MGNNTSSNIIDSVNDVTFDVLNSAIQYCKATNVNTNLLRVVGNSGGVTINDTFLTQNVLIKTNCLQNATTVTNIDNTLTQELNQLAESIIGSLNLTIGSNEANNIVRLVNQLGFEIKNEFYQDCQLLTANNNVIDIAYNTGPIVFQAVNLTQSIDNVQTCMANQSAVNDIKNELEQQIDQVAIAEKKGLLDFLGGFIWIIIIIVIVIFIFILGKGKLLSNPGLIIAIIFGALLLIDLYFIIGYFFKWSPYKKIGKLDNQPTVAEKNAYNRKIITIASIIGAVLLVLVIIGFVIASKSKPKATTTTTKK
jgi:hypothetical protein